MQGSTLLVQVLESKQIQYYQLQKSSYYNCNLIFLVELILLEVKYFHQLMKLLWMGRHIEQKRFSHLCLHLSINYKWGIENFSQCQENTLHMLCTQIMLIAKTKSRKTFCPCCSLCIQIFSLAFYC